MRYHTSYTYLHVIPISMCTHCIPRRDRRASHSLPFLLKYRGQFPLQVNSSYLITFPYTDLAAQLIWTARYHFLLIVLTLIKVQVLPIQLSNTLQAIKIIYRSDSITSPTWVGEHSFLWTASPCVLASSRCWSGVHKVIIFSLRHKNYLTKS